MAFDGGIECFVIDVDIFKHSRFVQPSSAFVSFLTTFLGAGATYRRISSFCSLDCYTCRLRNWFHRRSFGCLLSVPFESQIDIGTDLFTVQGVKVMLVFYNINKRQIWLKVWYQNLRGLPFESVNPTRMVSRIKYLKLSWAIFPFLIIYTFCTLLCLSLRLHHQGVKKEKKKIETRRRQKLSFFVIRQQDDGRCTRKSR